jgi:hypothetical protein
MMIPATITPIISMALPFCEPARPPVASLSTDRVYPPQYQPNLSADIDKRSLIFARRANATDTAQKLRT